MVTKKIRQNYFRAEVILYLERVSLIAVNLLAGF